MAQTFQNGMTTVKAPGMLAAGAIRLKMNNTGTPTIIQGNEWFVSALGGNVTSTTNTNAAVATITLDAAMVGLAHMTAEYFDDAQTGNYCTFGNANNVGTSNNVSFKVGFFLAAGTAMTAAQVNTNAVVFSVNFWWVTSNVSGGQGEGV